MHSGMVVVWLKDPKGIDSKKFLAGIRRLCQKPAYKFGRGFARSPLGDNVICRGPEDA